MIELIDSIQGQLLSALMVISLGFYLLQTLFGYRLFRASCAIVGFVIGLVAGILIASNVFHLTGAWPPIIGVLAGLALGFLSFKLFLVGLFILVFLIAFRLAGLIPFPDNGNWQILSFVVALGIAIISGILAVKFQKAVIIVITSVGGAFNAASVFNEMTGLFNSKETLLFGVAVALAVIGLLLQFLMNRE